MKNVAIALASAALILVGGVADANAQSSAGAEPDSSSHSRVPEAAFFAGLGGSYNSTEFGNQNVYAQGVSDIFLNGVLVGSGVAGGPANPSFDYQSKFAPRAQLGYFHHFSESTWLWGAKFSYSYQSVTATEKNFVIPQVGSFTSSVPGTFTGNVVVRSYRTSIEHQMAWMPFVGQSFENSYVYFGAGPSLSQLKFDLDGMIGFAALNGRHDNITGKPSHFVSAPWVFGGSAVVGATYFLNRHWFLDLSYNYAMTQTHTGEFSAPFATATDGYEDAGVISGNYSGAVITQSLRFSINRAF